MPYINPLDRPALDATIDELGASIRNLGELNYAITRLALKLIQERGMNYEQLSGVVGTLHLAATELEQRLVRAYEDKKKFVNGDVPEYTALLKTIVY